MSGKQAIGFVGNAQHNILASRLITRLITYI